ncbi:MAG: efflux transporter periplasmic adaptor subunit, partial [Clostridia bacterium]|nr:efflux transporter periplasmic adaptor subunit [Clostridia bacterium]
DGLGKFYVDHGITSLRVPMGYPGKFWVVLLEEENTLMIKKSAVILLDNSGNALVHKVNKDGTLQEVQIKVGLNNAEYYQILSGISDGEKVVVR